ncbi:MAG TPA: class I SAM-dependent RNA methyltransferase [Gemmatimonadaceae bacterium]
MDIFAATAPGLESIAAGELKPLGVRGNQEAGGVSFSGDNRLLYLANLHLRTPSRVIVRLGQFHASTFYEFERRAKKIPWQNFLPANSAVGVRVTCRKSRLYHSDAVAERVLGVIAKFASPGSNLRIASAQEDDTGSDEADVEVRGEGGPNGDATASSQSFVVRIVNDQCEISADSSGELLHRRGYRQEIAKAPLRETLAAAMILASGWRPDAPLIDPLCGSGTIPIEAALIARRIAPGIRRSFQFMRWPNFDSALWKDLLSKAEAETRPTSHGGATIHGADRDDGAIGAATRNAGRAGVAGDIEFATRSLSASLDSLEVIERGEGWVLTNPPYGIRVGEGADLRNLYARLGSVAAKAEWRVGMLVAEPRLARQAGVPLRSRFDTRNGGIPVSFLASEKGGKSAAEQPDSDG